MSKSKRDDMTVEYGSGNVFADLGLENADELLVKADLMHAIAREIKARGLTQKQASDLIGLSQSDISNVARNKIDRFSHERLIAALRPLGLDVEINLRRSKTACGTVRLRDHA